MALRLKLKKLDPELEALYQVRPPVRVKIVWPKQRRIKAIEDYAKRQKQRSVTDKEKDFQDIDEFQNWVEARIRGPASTWQRWDGMIEEWDPWNLFGEPVNIWRYRKLQ